MAQFARPDSNIIQLTMNGGFAEIDEAVASDADFAWATPGNNSQLEVGLSNVTDPQSSTGHVLRYRIAKVDTSGVLDGAGNTPLVTVRVFQGATQIATDVQRSTTGTWTTFTYTLSAAEADAITDYTDLRIEAMLSNSGGNPSNRRGGAISWAELEVPDPPAGGNQFNQPVSGTLSFTGAVTRRAAKALSASLGFTGAVARRTSRAFTGALGFSGSAIKRTSRSTNGSVSFTTTSTKRTSRQTTATITFTAVFDADLQMPGTPALVIIHIHTE